MGGCIEDPVGAAADCRGSAGADCLGSGRDRRTRATTPETQAELVAHCSGRQCGQVAASCPGVLLGDSPWRDPWWPASAVAMPLQCARELSGTTAGTSSPSTARTAASR